MSSQKEWGLPDHEDTAPPTLKRGRNSSTSEANGSPSKKKKSKQLRFSASLINNGLFHKFSPCTEDDSPTSVIKKYQCFDYLDHNSDDASHQRQGTISLKRGMKVISGHFLNFDDGLTIEDPVGSIDGFAPFNVSNLRVMSKNKSDYERARLMHFMCLIDSNS